MLIKILLKKIFICLTVTAGSESISFKIPTDYPICLITALISHHFLRLMLMRPHSQERKFTFQIKFKISWM